MVEEADLNPPRFKFNPLVLAVFFGGLFLLALGVGLVFLNQKPEEDFKIVSGAQVAGESSYSKASEDDKKVLVHVDGAVAKPGVYKLAGDLRVDDAVKAAGGMTSDADSAKVNLAAKIADGQKVLIPNKSQGISGQSLEVGKSQLVSINSGTQAELEGLPGIGPVTAQKIMSLRPYSSVDELLSKKAVSSSVFAKVKDLISL